MTNDLPNTSQAYSQEYSQALCGTQTHRQHVTALQRDKVFVTFKNDARNFYHLCAHYQQENLMQGTRLVNKGGKNQQKQKQTTFDQEHEKNAKFPKEKKKSCFCFDTSLIQSFNIKFKVRALKSSHFFCFASENLFSALMRR